MKAIVISKSAYKKIFIIRGKRIMLDFHLAELYGVETKALKQQVKRNLDRFPEDFMFRLTQQEFENLRSQIVTSSWGGIRYLPFAFTEQGVAMLSSILKSKRAIRINVEIMRMFVKLREFALTNKELFRKIKELEKKYDGQFEKVFEALNYLLTEKQKLKERKPIGYKIGKK